MEIEDLKLRCEHAASAWNDMQALRDSAGNIAGVHVPVVLSSYDWREAFGAAGKADTTVSADLRWPITTNANNPDPPEPFGRTDVAFITAIVEGENDGPNGVCVGRLITGEWFTVTAGCDYPGWGCQQWGQAYVDSDLDAILRLGLSDEDRNRLLPVADDELFARVHAGESDY